MRTASRRLNAELRGQRGQALILALVLMMIASLAMFFMFSAGQVASTKQRLTNAADAAAYSAALWRARVLNYDAYSNRAIIAQEVAIAQAVTLTSWAKYFETTVHTVVTVLSAVLPVLAPALQALDEVVGYTRELAEEAARIEVWLRGAPEVGYKNLLAASQELLHLSIGTFGLGAVANEIARANDRRFFAFALPDDGAFDRFTRRYASDEDRMRLRDLVVDSLDSFVAGPRGADLVLPLPSGCAGSSTDPRQWVQWLRKRGGTVMAPDLERWEAADTLSMHDWRRGGGFFSRGCRQQETIPIGWGAAEAAENGNGSLQSDPGGAVSTNPMAGDEAQQEMASLDGYSGISRVRELDYERLETDRFPISRLAVLARIEGTDVRTARTTGAAGGRLALEERFAGGRLWALSSAEVYFRRPPGDARIEFASLYNPYWQVRLSAPTPAQRAVAESYVR